MGTDLSELEGRQALHERHEKPRVRPETHHSARGGPEGRGHEALPVGGAGPCKGLWGRARAQWPGARGRRTRGPDRAPAARHFPQWPFVQARPEGKNTVRRRGAQGVGYGVRWSCMRFSLLMEGNKS